ncbi:MAG: DNA polymerase I [Candidatus Gastranaerophilaceae bacterium]|jgi:DNA polymerase-1
MTNKKTLILIDGHALAYRMFFALERTGMKTSDNQPTWAIYGFFKALFDLLKKIKPDAIAVSFDCGRETFRLREYAEYKANRVSMPDSLKEQMELLCEGIKAFDIPIYQKPDYEADDVIGTIAREASELGHNAFILTGDRDSFQLVDKEGYIKILIPSKGELTEYDREKVYERMGVWPEQIADYKGLSGDASDNIPGVKGIGEKTAVKLLAEFETVENVYQNIDKILSASLRSKLETDKEMAFKSKFLATIDKNVPIDFDFEHTHLNMPNIQTVTEYLKKMEFFTFLKQLPEILKSFNGQMPVRPEQQTLQTEEPSENQTQGQLNFSFAQETVSNILKTEYSANFEKEIIDTKEKFEKLINKLKAVEIFSIDTETTNVDPYKAQLVGISVGWDEKLFVKDDRLYAVEISETKTAYIPVGHIEGEQLEINFVLQSFKPLLENADKYKIFQNAKYEIIVFNNYHIDINGILFDTMIASYVKDPSFKHGLKSQAFSHLKFQMQEIEELIGKGKSQITMDKVSIEDTSKYACADAFATLELAKFHQKTMDESQLKLFYEIEMPLIKVLSNMEITGVSLDTEYLSGLAKEIESNLQVIEAKIYSDAGMKFNINSPKQVGDVLFEKMQIPAKIKTKSKEGYSTSAKVLEYLAKDYPIANLLLEQRHLSKIKSTYIDALPLLLSKKDNRLHTSFNQTITTTGRLSSSNPNLQNIPIRTEIGNRIRAAFVPEDKENSIILSADYSQIELRLLAHFSQDPNLLEAFRKNIDIHTATASKVFDVEVEQVTKEMRRKAKAVNFGIIYGQTSYGLSESIGITPQEAKSFIEKYFATYPKIKDYIFSSAQKAHQAGYAETMFGRRRYFGEDLNSRNKMIREFAERAAVNAPLQGTAADLIKIAMIKLYEKLNLSGFKSKLIMQVHDELVIETRKEELKAISNLVKDCMELGQPLDVPLIVDMQYGSSWMETKNEVMAINL